MTPDHKFVLISNALTALPAFIFTGAAACWAWWRDQERIIVQKSPQHWTTEDGTETDATLTGVGIVVRNLSLYPVRIAGLGFRVDGKTVMSLDRDKHMEEWPLELASRARMLVYTDTAEWNRFGQLGLRARIRERQFEAVAVTETGMRFSSERPSVKIMRPIRAILRKVDIL